MEALSSLLPFLFLSTGAIAVWVLRPIHRAARSRRAPAQLALIDFLCLIFLAQLPMAVIGWFGGTFNPRGTWVLYVFGWVACGLLWWVAVRLLSRAGVRQARRRAVFQVFVLPATVFGVIVVPVLTVVLLGLAARGLTDREDAWRLAVAAAVDLALFGGLIVAGPCCRWVVAGEPGNES